MIAAGERAMRVTAVEALSPSLKRLVLEAADGGLLPTSLPGAHVTLTLAAAGRVHRNSYSVVGHPDERTGYAIVVRRTEGSRGGSAHIHERLAVGDVVGATAPDSFFPLHNRARRHVLIGGGIGITPLLSFLPVLRERGQRFELHQFARPDEVEVFARLLAPEADDRVRIHAGRGGTSIHDILAAQPLGTHVYCCGPDRLMDAVRHAAVDLGWPPASVHFENFGATGGDPFIVRLGRTGGEVRVKGDETMLEALETAGIAMRSLCRGGACGECATRVVDGTPDHRDHYLDDAERAEGRLVMPCVSRSMTPSLTLDL